MENNQSEVSTKYVCGKTVRPKNVMYLKLLSGRNGCVTT